MTIYTIGVSWNLKCITFLFILKCIYAYYRQNACKAQKCLILISEITLDRSDVAVFNNNKTVKSQDIWLKKKDIKWHNSLGKDQILGQNLLSGNFVNLSYQYYYMHINQCKAHTQYKGINAGAIEHDAGLQISEL